MGNAIGAFFSLGSEPLGSLGFPGRFLLDLYFWRLVGDTMNRQEALAMEGSGWDADLEAMRESRSAVRE